METKGSYQEELERIARDGDQTELVYRGNFIHQLYLTLEKRQEASPSSVDEGPLDDENYLFKTCCSLTSIGGNYSDTLAKLLYRQAQFLKNYNFQTAFYGAASLFLWVPDCA